MFKLYAKLADKLLIFSSAVSDSFSSEAVGIIPPQKDVSYLDVTAARNDENTKLLVFIVNRNLFRDIDAEVTIRGYEPAQVVVKHLRGPSFESSNYFHEPWLVDLMEQTKSIAEVTDYATGRLRLSFPKHSLTVLYFTREEWI